MGLSNNYIGETKYVGERLSVFSPSWCHRAANKKERALTEGEAEQVSEILFERIATATERNNLSGDKRIELFQQVCEQETVGRVLEEDEEEFLEENAGFVVVDV